MSSRQWQPKDTSDMISCRGKKDEHDDDNSIMMMMTMLTASMVMMRVMKARN